MMRTERRPKDYVICARVDVATAARVREIAESMGLTVSELLRHLLERYVSEHKAEAHA